MKVRPIRAARLSRQGTRDEDSKFSLDMGIGGIEHLTTRHHHDVNGTGRLVVAEKLSYQAFGSVAHHCAAELSSRSDPESRGRSLGKPDENRHQAAAALETSTVHPFEVRPASNVFGGEESPAHPGARRAAGSTVRRTPSVVFDPSRAGASAHAVRFWCPSARETRGSAGAGGCSAETCAFPSASPRTSQNHPFYSAKFQSVKSLRACYSCFRFAGVFHNCGKTCGNS
jgi:hypothetical protein